LLKIEAALLYSFHFIFGEFSIASINLFSQNISCVQSFSDLFIASVIQSLYKIITSLGLNGTCFSLRSFDISLIIQRATQPDLIL
jgi:hypothetical protein